MAYELKRCDQIRRIADQAPLGTWPWLIPGERGCSLGNGPKLAVGPFWHIFQQVVL